MDVLASRENQRNAENIYRYTDNSRGARSAQMILVPLKYRTISSKNSYLMAITLFNSLPNELKQLKDTYSRKRKLKEWTIKNI